MPTYEYECTQCGQVSEVYQPISQEPRKRFKKGDNPQCNCQAAVRRLLGKGAGIIFKGSGFYQTDYRSEKYKEAAKAEKEGAEGKPKKDAGKDSTKPAEKDVKEFKPKATAPTAS